MRRSPGHRLVHGPTLRPEYKRGKVRLRLQPCTLSEEGPSDEHDPAPAGFTTLPDEHTLQATVVALEEHGFSVEVARDLDDAREAVLARIPQGSSVMTNTSVTLTETGIAEVINGGGDRGNQRATRCSRSTSPPRRRR